MTHNEYKDYVKDVFDELVQLFEKKNHDYGNSILTPPYLLPDMDLRQAIELRMSDKINRIRTLLKTQAQVDESLEDTFRDLAVYAVNWIAISRYLKDNQNDNRN